MGQMSSQCSKAEPTDFGDDRLGREIGGFVPSSVLSSRVPRYWAILQGEKFVQPFNSFEAQLVDLSLWHDVQGLVMPDCSVSLGVIKRNV